ncbi:MAG: L-2-hydroxyglutarate oxidase [Saprospiraceae bacterium]|nr:L-2-hydroxyglutarate oxidase [Saprospiraceae bacterium]
MLYDVAIIGGGIVGLSTAHQLLQERPGLSVCLLEKEPAVASHQSRHNSGVLHSGIYYKPGSLRALNCRKGHQLMVSFCEKHGLPYELCGKLIVATKESELQTLTNIYDRGVQNGLSNLKIISSEEAKEIEPKVRCLRAILVPQAGITSFGTVTECLASLFKEAGGEIMLDSTVQHIQEENDQIVIETSNASYRCRHLITCAGLYADKITKMTIPDCPYRILPFRGEYYELVPSQADVVKHLIYPVPNTDFPFLGVHFTKLIGGGIEAGPNAVLAFQKEGYHHNQVDASELTEILGFKGFQKLAIKYWRTGLAEMYRSYSKSAFIRAMQELIPSITSEDAKRGRSGVRAMACDPNGNLIDDFLFLETKRVINVMSAPSPAATASLAIGQDILERISKKLI